MGFGHLFGVEAHEMHEANGQLPSTQGLQHGAPRFNVKGVHLDLRGFAIAVDKDLARLGGCAHADNLGLVLLQPGQQGITQLLAGSLGSLSSSNTQRGSTVPFSGSGTSTTSETGRLATRTKLSGSCCSPQGSSSTSTSSNSASRKALFHMSGARSLETGSSGWGESVHHQGCSPRKKSMSGSGLRSSITMTPPGASSFFDVVHCLADIRHLVHGVPGQDQVETPPHASGQIRAFDRRTARTPCPC